MTQATYSKRTLNKIYSLFDQGLNPSRIGKRLCRDRHTIACVLKTKYGADAFQKINSKNRKFRQYSKKEIELIVKLIDAKKLTLKQIMRTIKTSKETFNRDMSIHYGQIEWENIVAEYRAKRGIQKGEHRCKEHEFKKEQIRGMAARRYKCVGSIMIKKIRYGQGKLQYETTQEELKKCIAAGWQKHFEEPMGVADIKDFELRGDIVEMDIENILMGSCLGELVQGKQVAFRRVK